VRNLFFGLLFVGCAGGVDIDPQVVTPDLDPAVGEELAELEPCGMAFHPDPELQGAVAQAGARWSVATGCDVRAEEGGVPVYAYAHLYSTSEPDREICGSATWSEDGAEVIRLDVSLACNDVEDTVTHEVGHALARLKGHSFTGVMASGMNEDRTGVIDASSLELVCYLFDCVAFNTEV
jgi:hypothetical protein